MIPKAQHILIYISFSHHFSMRVLLLIAHADPKHQAAAYRIADVAKLALEQAKHEVRVVDLVQEGFDRVATVHDFIKLKEGPFEYHSNATEDNQIDVIKKQHANVNWCDNILIIGPMWFFRYPACLDAYIERVFTNQKFAEKRISMVLTNGGDEQYYSEQGEGSLEQFLFPTYFAFKYSGHKVNRPLGYYNAGPFCNSTPEEEKAWLEKFKLAVVKLENWQLWGTNKNVPPLNPETIIM